MRKAIVAANWKMNGTRSSVISLVEAIKRGITSNKVEVIVFPSFIHIQQVEQLLVGTHIHWGAQNIYLGESGAFTGEISAPMVTDYGCRSVLIGHSERRILFHEDLSLVANKFETALHYGLQPILCIGETLAEREAGQTESVIQKQLGSIIESAGVGAFHQAIIAYEPVWAIGTGKTASAEQAQSVHAYIRQMIANEDKDIADRLRILYGGSVKADNAHSLFAMPDIDGGLVGGASLDAKTFLAICGATE